MENEKKYLLRENRRYFTTGFLRKEIPDEVLESRIRDDGLFIRQGYLPVERGLSIARRFGDMPDFSPIEARLREKNGKYTLNFKGAGTGSRPEHQISMDQESFSDLWSHTNGFRVEKYRMTLPWHGACAELDLYVDGRDLIVAEVEVPAPEELARVIPLGQDITDDTGYKNRNLAR